MREFPKLMWAANGVEIVVGSQTEQDAKEAEGYLLIQPGTPAAHAAAAAAVEPEGTGDEPTFGPPDDDTYTKRGKKKGA